MRYLCIKDVFDSNGELLGKQGDTVELDKDSLDKRERKRAAAILMSNGDSALREVGEEPKKKTKKKKKAAYKTRQIEADNNASD